MRDRSLFGALIALSLVVPLTSCSNPSGLDSISVSPATQSLTAGQSAQLTATGTFGNAKHTSSQDVTSTVNWSSNAPGVASVSRGGLVTAVSAGTAVVSASAQGFNGPVSSSATITVTSSGGTTGGGSVVSITITPGSQSVTGSGQTVQFIAIGTTSSGATVNLTGQVIWTSSATSIATINASSGLATSVGAGTTTITALYSASSSGTTVTGTASLTVTGGTSTGFTALTITPGSQALSATGQTGQFIALGTTGAGTVLDVTDSPNIVWSSSSPSIATVNAATGLATGVNQGTTTITAKLTNTDNSVVLATATVNVSVTSPPEPILSLTIIPSSITVLNFNLTGQFLAIGTFSTSPYVRDMTNSPTTTWLSSEPEIFPVNTNTGGNAGSSAGLVTAVGNGGATIIAESASTDGTIQTATATFSCPYQLPSPPTPGSCYPNEPPTPTLLATLTVYNEGNDNTNWEVTAPSATGTPNVLHCGPGWTGAGGSVCTATYPMEATTPSGNPGVVLEAQGGAFGGWSYNCVPSDADGNFLPGPTLWTATGPNYCVATLTGSYVDTNGNTVVVDGINQSIGAIFN